MAQPNANLEEIQTALNALSEELAHNSSTTMTTAAALHRLGQICQAPVLTTQLPSDAALVNAEERPYSYTKPKRRAIFNQHWLPQQEPGAPCAYYEYVQSTDKSTIFVQVHSQDPYATLGVSPMADEQHLQAAYQQQRQTTMLHEDKWKNLTLRLTGEYSENNLSKKLTEMIQQAQYSGNLEAVYGGLSNAFVTAIWQKLENLPEVKSTQAVDVKLIAVEQTITQLEQELRMWQDDSTNDNPFPRLKQPLNLHALGNVTGAPVFAITPMKSETGPLEWTFDNNNNNNRSTTFYEVNQASSTGQAQRLVVVDGAAAAKELGLNDNASPQQWAEHYYKAKLENYIHYLVRRFMSKNQNEKVVILPFEELIQKHFAALSTQSISARDYVVMYQQLQQIMITLEAEPVDLAEFGKLSGIMILKLPPTEAAYSHSWLPVDADDPKTNFLELYQTDSHGQTTRWGVLLTADPYQALAVNPQSNDAICIEAYESLHRKKELTERFEQLKKNINVIESTVTSGIAINMLHAVYIQHGMVEGFKNAFTKQFPYFEKETKLTQQQYQAIDKHLQEIEWFVQSSIEQPRNFLGNVQVKPMNLTQLGKFCNVLVLKIPARPNMGPLQWEKKVKSETVSFREVIHANSDGREARWVIVNATDPYLALGVAKGSDNATCEKKYTELYDAQPTPPSSEHFLLRRSSASSEDDDDYQFSNSGSFDRK